MQLFFVSSLTYGDVTDKTKMKNNMFVRHKNIWNSSDQKQPCVGKMLRFCWPKMQVKPYKSQPYLARQNWTHRFFGHTFFNKLEFKWFSDKIFLRWGLRDQKYWMFDVSGEGYLCLLRRRSNCRLFHFVFT